MTSLPVSYLAPKAYPKNTTANSAAVRIQANEILLEFFNGGNRAAPQSKRGASVRALIFGGLRASLPYCKNTADKKIRRNGNASCARSWRSHQLRNRRYPRPLYCSDARQSSGLCRTDQSIQGDCRQRLSRAAA